LIKPGERAPWLAELASALDEAQKLLSRFVSEGSQQQVFALKLRISAVQAQVRSLQCQSASRLSLSNWEWPETAIWVESSNHAANNT
jgi:hypothetical protein